MCFDLELVRKLTATITEAYNARQVFDLQTLSPDEIEGIYESDDDDKGGRPLDLNPGYEVAIRILATQVADSLALESLGKWNTITPIDIKQLLWKTEEFLKILKD